MDTCAGALLYMRISNHYSSEMHIPLLRSSQLYLYSALYNTVFALDLCNRLFV